MPSVPSHPCICAAAGIASASRSAIAAFKRNVCVAPLSSVKRTRTPSDIPCKTQPVTIFDCAISSPDAAPGLVFARAASHRRNCDSVKLPGIAVLQFGSVSDGIVELRPCNRNLAPAMPQSNRFDLSAARAACLHNGTGHFPSDCHRRGLSSHSRPVIPVPQPMAGDCGRSTSSRNARAIHSSGDGSAAASVTRFNGLRPVRVLNSAGGFGLRLSLAEA